MKDNEAPFFFVMNADIMCEYPLQTLIDFHKSHGKEVSMMMTSVEDPSKYGVIVCDEDGKVTRFVEKPNEFINNKVNSGIYIFNNTMLDKIQLKPHYLEKDVFPKLCEQGQLYCCNLPGYWMDIGAPKAYIAGTKYYL